MRCVSFFFSLLPPKRWHILYFTVNGSNAKSILLTEQFVSPEPDVAQSSVNTKLYDAHYAFLHLEVLSKSIPVVVPDFHTFYTV